MNETVMPYLLAAGLGLAVYLVYDGCTRPGSAAGRPDRLRAVHDFLARAGLPEVRPAAFVGFSLASGLLLGLFAALLTGWPAVTVVAALAGLAGPLLYYMHRHNRRRAQLQSALSEAISQLRDHLKIGFSVADSLVGLAETGPEALRPEFARLVRHMRADRLDRALIAMRERLADPVCDLFAASLLISDESGGRSLGAVLDGLAQATRAELRTQQEIRSYQARTVLAARIIAAVPLVLLMGLHTLRPGYFSVFQGAGQLWLAAVFVLIAAGYGGMLYVARVPGEGRVLH